jgi:hypothetical protein
MSLRSIHLRDQAQKCLLHALALTDAQTQVELRKLAAEYVVQATDMEREQERQGAVVG